MMRLTLCLPRKLMHSLLSSLRNWKNVLIIVLLISFTVVAIVQKYWDAARLQFLLEYDLSESPTRQQTLRNKMAFQSRIETTCTNDSDVDNRVEFYEPSKCPRSISSLSNYSQWFQRRFKPNIKLFIDKLDAENIRNLSFYELPFGFKNEDHDFIENVLCHKNFKNPLLSLRGDNKCISCAVVGSGGILNGSHAGGEIDAHDLVFRLNAAVTYGKHGKDVGRRTDFYMFFPESAHLSGLVEKNVTLLYTMYKSFDVKYAAEILDINRRRKSQKVNPKRLKIIHPDFFRYIFAKFLDARSMKPTTGAIGVMLAVHLCDSVTIYGFGYDPRFSVYYYDSTFRKHAYKSTWAHDVDNEKKLWDKLHHEGVIRYFKRDVM